MFNPHAITSNVQCYPKEPSVTTCYRHTSFQLWLATVQWGRLYLNHDMANWNVHELAEFPPCQFMQ